MFSSKLLLVVLALLCVANTEGKQKKKLEYRVKGTEVGPDETGYCYEGDLLTRDGETVVGAFKDCVAGIPVELEEGVTLFTVVTYFYPDDEIDIITTCDITVTQDPSLLSQGYSATETCKSKNKKGAIISPDDQQGKVKMDGLVYNWDFPLLTFDLNWTIVLKE